MESDINELKHSLEWGETLYKPKEEVEFSFSYEVQESKYMLEVKFLIPLKKTVKELAYRLISSHSMPCYIYDSKFVFLCFIFIT